MATDQGLHNVDDKGPILEILMQARVRIENENNLDQETMDLLPSWTQVQNLYGSEPKILGWKGARNLEMQWSRRLGFLEWRGLSTPAPT
jgi:hypothetical protein